MNAIAPRPADEAAERTARHMRVLAELSELGMQMARIAAARYEATQEPPDAEPEAQAGTATAVPARKHSDPGPLFTRLGRLVRDCIAMESRLAAGLLPTRQAPIEKFRRTDPRRAPLREAFQIVTEKHQYGAEILRDTTERLDQALAADPNNIFNPAEIFGTLCDEIGLEVDPDALRQIGRHPAFQNLADQVKTPVPACAAYPPQ